MPVEQICRLSGKTFIISDKEITYCKEHDIPLPTASPIERLRRMTSFDNGIHLYNGICALTGKNILTNVPPELGHPVYSPDIFASDAWDPMQYGRSYDFSRSFFEQFGDLFQQVPLPSRFVILSTLENSEYVNGITGAKNCYLIFNSTYSEDCLFSRLLSNCKNVVDSICVQNSELCYACVNVQISYNLLFAENCSNCQDSYFLFNCRNVKHCYGCSNLSGKEYYFENQPCTPEEYANKLKTKDLGSYQVLLQELNKYEEVKRSTPRKYMQGNQSEDCTGNYIDQSQNCTDCFNTIEAQDVVCGFRVVKSKDVYAAFAAINAEQIYACYGCLNNAYNIRWSISCPNNVRDLEYCIHTGFGCHDCFGCVGLRQKEYCIFNKQYSKEEYFEMLAKIKAQMKTQNEYGELFPASLSPQYYNESYAMEFAPLSREEALKRGHRWKDEAVINKLSPSIIPDHITTATDAILAEVLTCTMTGKQYRLTKAELDFYRRFNLPIPRIAPLVRLEKLSSIMEMKSLVTRQCDHCDTSMQSVYRDQLVLCESCYMDATC